MDRTGTRPGAETAISAESQPRVRGFVVAGTHSGVGKTTLTLGLLAALRNRGVSVQPFKIGPDFIDPGHHAAVCGRQSRNLDGWMLSRTYNCATFARSLHDGAVGVVEGMMGLFDGRDGDDEAGSTAEMAKWLGLPVVLVVDASGMARSVAAVMHGFATFDARLDVVGVVFNRIAGPGHLRFLEEAMRGLPRVHLLGGVPMEETVSLPERHLGLVTAQERPLSHERIGALAALVERHVDVSALLELRGSSPAPRLTSREASSAEDGACPALRFGVARDEAFCFYYPENLELLERAGARLVFFSPLHDGRLPADLHGLYLGGGYPESHAAWLFANTAMREAVRAHIEREKPVYAECGGFMYLTRGIRDVAGRFFPMVGAYPTVARMLPRLSRLGYVEVDMESSAGLFPPMRVRGHEFHYSELESPMPSEGRHARIESIYRVRGRTADESRTDGYRYKRCLAGYPHLHFGSNPRFARHLVDLARTSVVDDGGRISV